MECCYNINIITTSLFDVALPELSSQFTYHTNVTLRLFVISNCQQTIDIFQDSQCSHRILLVRIVI